MFFAALGQVRPGLEPDERDGFVIITADSDQWMVDIHDRRPVVLSAEHAREWVDPNTSALRAEELARKCCREVGDFVWYPVGKEVGNVRNQGAELLTHWSLSSNVHGHSPCDRKAQPPDVTRVIKGWCVL